MTEAQRALRRQRLVLWALLVSLAVNGFLVGALATGFLAPERERRGMFWLETRFVGENLPPSEQEALRASLRDMIPEMRVSWRRLRELRREINMIAAEPEPDREAIDSRLAEIRDITRDMQADVQAHVFDRVLDLPADTRAELARDDDNED